MLRIAALAFLFLPMAALADDKDDGYKSLFNGKDLSGWITPEDKSLFTVENGEIIGRTKGDLKKNQFLITEKTYGDFSLKTKVKIRNGNSGIQIRSKRNDDGTVAGPQADIADGYWGVLYDEKGSRGIIDRYDPKKAEALAKKGDWNDMTVTMKGDHLTITLNGTIVIERDEPMFAKTGIIGLQVHVGPPMEVRFKDLMIKAD